MKLLVKGIVTREDAELAMQHGVDGVFVSNHGGRAENSLRSTIECVADVVAGVKGRAPMLVDSGFRRGTRHLQGAGARRDRRRRRPARTSGASPSFGQEGVETVLDILRRELQLIMRQSGVTSISGITRNHIVRG